MKGMRTCFGFQKVAAILILVMVWQVISVFPTQVKAETKGFYVKNGKLYDANDQVFIMKGVNHAHTWYKDSDETALKAIAATGANTVRLVLSDGQQWTYDDVNTVKELIKLCKKNKLICVLEVHDGTGSDSADMLEKIGGYWIEIKEALIGNEDTVILNIANEWYGSWDSDVWAKAYISVIPKLRNAGINNTIMVDCAGYGQYPQSIHDKGKSVFQSDPLGNLIFSMHMYEYAGKDASTIKSNIDGVVNQGLPVCIGEFGYKHTSGDVDEDYLLNYCEKLGIGWLAWSWYGNSDNVKYLDLATNMAGTSFTEWGKILTGHKYGLSTGKVASVFQQNPSVGDPTKEPDIEPTLEPTIEPTIEPTMKPIEHTDQLELQYSTNQWSGGYMTNINITNNSTSKISTWSLALSKSDFSITNIWGASLTESGDAYIITPLSWNNAIEAGKTVGFGFTAKGSFPQNFIYQLK